MVEMKKTLPREANKNPMLPSFMQENNNSRMNLATMNSKSLRENNFSKRDFYSPKSDFKSKEEYISGLRNKKDWMRHTIGNQFMNKERNNSKKKNPREDKAKYDSDDEDSLSELFHKHDL